MCFVKLIFSNKFGFTLETSLFLYSDEKVERKANGLKLSVTKNCKIFSNCKKWQVSEACIRLEPTQMEPHIRLHSNRGYLALPKSCGINLK